MVNVAEQPPGLTIGSIAMTVTTSSLLAFPNGIAMIGLGASLWLSQRQVADQTRPAGEVLPTQAAVRGPPKARRGRCRITSVRFCTHPQRLSNEN